MITKNPYIPARIIYTFSKYFNSSRVKIVIWIVPSEVFFLIWFKVKRSWILRYITSKPVMT